MDPMTPDEPVPPADEAPPSRITIAAYLERITPHAWVTPLLVGLIVAGFVVELRLGASPMSPTAEQLLKAGGNFGPSVSDGEWWRVPASLFLHAGVVHIAFNVWAFWSIGRFAERVFGNIPFLIIYLLSGLGGGLASLAVHPLTVCVGASGAIFGVYGAMLSFVLLHKGVFPPEFLAQQRNSLFGFLGYNLVFSLSIPNVDLSAHGGGLVTGLLAGGLLGRDLARPAANVGRRVAAALAITLAIGLLGTRVKRRIDDMSVVKADRLAREALALLQAKKLPEAIRTYTEAITLEDDAGWVSNRGLAYLWQKNYPLALADFLAAHKKEPTPRTAGLVCEGASHAAKTPDDLEAAVRWCTDAAGRDPKNAQVLAWRASIQDDLSHEDLALTDAAAALAIDPKNDMALRVRMTVHLKQQKVPELEADCVQLLAQPSDPGAPIDVVCADVARVLENATEQRARLDRALKEDPTNVAALLARAGLNTQEKRVKESVADYRACVLVAPDKALAWNNLAWGEVVLGEFPAALQDAERAVALVGDDANYLGTRGFAHAGLGQLDDARKDCMRAVSLNPGSKADRGMLAFLDHDTREARRLWQEASADPVLANDLAPWMAKLPPK